LLDRIDLHVEVAGVSAADLTLPPPCEGSAEVACASPRRAAVQAKRFNGDGVRTNAEADGELLDRIATPDEPGRKLLADAAAAMRLSARGYHRVLKVARTIADGRSPTTSPKRWSRAIRSAESTVAEALR
jgi:magnesium chelatase family protein